MILGSSLPDQYSSLLAAPLMPTQGPEIRESRHSGSFRIGGIPLENRTEITPTCHREGQVADSCSEPLVMRINLATLGGVER